MRAKKAIPIAVRKAKSALRFVDRLYHQHALTPWITGLPIAVATLLAVTQSSSELDGHHFVRTPIQSPLLKSSIASQPEHPESWKYFYPAWGSAWSFWSSTPVYDFGTDGDRLVSDPDDRLEEDFKIPEYLKSRVAFWVRVYSKYGRNIRVIHDRNRVELLYGIVDLGPLHRQYGDSATFETHARRVEREILRSIRQLIMTAAKSPPSGNLSADHLGMRNTLSQHGALDPIEARSLTETIRTQTGQRDAFIKALHRAMALLPHIESVLKQHGLPVTLARIPFVESSFNVSAQSKIGAVGIWQFTPETAKEWIAKDDEHLWSDPIRQTRGAARLLRGYRSALPDWSTTITSYNSGIGRLRRLLQKHRTNSIEKLLSVREENGLGFAGKNFFAEVLAATLVERYKEVLFGDHLLPDVEANIALKPSTPTADRCEK